MGISICSASRVTRWGWRWSRTATAVTRAIRAEVEKATQSLLDLKPHVAKFTTDLGPVIASGDAWLMEGWTTQIYQGLVQTKDPSNVGFSVPPNGPLLACDMPVGRA